VAVTELRNMRHFCQHTSDLTRCLKSHKHLTNISTQYWKKLPAVQSNLPPPATCNESDGSRNFFWKMRLFTRLSRSL